MAADLRNDESNEASSASAMESICRTPSHTRINVSPEHNSFVADDVTLSRHLSRAQISHGGLRGAGNTSDRPVLKPDSLFMSIFRIDNRNPFQ